MSARLPVACRNPGWDAQVLMSFSHPRIWCTGSTIEVSKSMHDVIKAIVMATMLNGGNGADTGLELEVTIFVPGLSPS